MKIDAVRKMTRKRIAALGMSDAAYAREIKVTQNNLYLFLAAKGAYSDTVPKAILKEFGLKSETTTNYYEVNEWDR